MSARYTHRITWSEWNEYLKMWVDKSFPTTEDAVPLHVAGLKVRGITPKIERI